MGLDAWLTLAVLLGVVYVLARDLLGPAVAIVGAVVVLLVTGVITPAEAFQGFSNPAPITVAALYVLARAVEKTGALQPVVNAVLGEKGHTRLPLARLVFPTAAASAFLNNTPIVAMLVPQVTEWAHRRGQSPSRYLMPLSFAAILGGMVTLIGTSTNLVVSGLLEASGHEPLAMFELTRYALPIALIGLVIIVLLAPRVLPDRRPARRQIQEDVREFVVTMRVQEGGPLVGRAVEEAGLRHLQGVFLAELERGGEAIAPVGPGTVLRGGDVLVFVGRADTVVDLQAIKGLASTEEQHLLDFASPRHTFFEVVVGAASPLVGKTLRATDFRSRYQAAVVAIHRAGERVREKLGTVPLRVGDTLLLVSDSGFKDRWRDRTDFLLVSRLGGSPPAATRKAGIVALVGAAIVVGAGLGLQPILHLSLLGALALVGLKVLTPGEAKSAVDLEVVLVIAAAFGLAAALDASGLAATIAGLLADGLGDFGASGVLLGLVLVTIALKAVVTNNAAAALMFPIALSTAETFGYDVRSVAIGVALAASASFLTPISYQTNLMVYGPGGYRFGDYFRLGVGLVAVVVVGVVVMVGG
jgi:di/tricarboxylate transporter